jgi:hypothetical protein
MRMKPFSTAMKREKVLTRFRQLCWEKGWDAPSGKQDSVQAESGLTTRSAGDDIGVSVMSIAEGAHVHLSVTPRFDGTQLIDWGEGSDIEREVTARLGAYRLPKLASIWRKPTLVFPP